MKEGGPMEEEDAKRHGQVEVERAGSSVTNRQEAL